ncbi:MAG TPA: hypothetical protein VMF03_16190 [Steroidobacteraceae bacterium]|nr:hypothetical protein [Steroidobacteraceae bacterium]
MTEVQKLTELRHKLIARRRALVDSFQKVAGQQLSGESIVEIQSAIEAVDRAIVDEREGDSTAAETPRRISP